MQYMETSMETWKAWKEFWGTSKADATSPITSLLETCLDCHQIMN